MSAAFIAGSSEPSTSYVRLVKRLTHVLAETLRGARDGIGIAQRYDALSRLGEAELARRGIGRADITRLAIQGWLGSNRTLLSIPEQARGSA
jgi:hypothetical protein